MEISNKIALAGIVISFLVVFLPLYLDIITNPDIKISLGPTTSHDKYISSEVIVKNKGLKPATNLRITINPSDEILNFEPKFYTEDMSLKQNGPNSLIGKMDRLANPQTVKINVNLNATEIEQYSIFVTHDTGSTTYFYHKDAVEQIDIRLIITVLISVIGAIAGGLASKQVGKRIEITTQIADNGGANLNNITAINSSLNITTKEKSKNEPTKVSKTESKESIKKLLEEIGSEKISNLLQRAKIIAIEEKDKEFQQWIELELNGYVPPGKTMTRGQIKKKGFIPEYRDINGRFYVQFGEGETKEMKYPIFFGNGIKNIEDSIEKMKTGGKLYIPHTFSKDLPLMGGKSGDLEIIVSELEKLIHGAENHLSKYLEQKFMS